VAVLKKGEIGTLILKHCICQIGKFHTFKVNIVGKSIEILCREIGIEFLQSQTQGDEVEL